MLLDMIPSRPGRGSAAVRVLTLSFAVFAPLCGSGCANFIRESDAVVSDAEPGTIYVGFEDQRLDGALFRGKVRFTCQKRLYALTNIYETQYSGSAELYEVPVGLIAFVPAFLWYGVTKLISLGAAESSGSVGPLNWATAGLNPFLNVENGMFRERYTIRKKPGSQRPQEGSTPEPYSAIILPKSPVRAAFERGLPVEVALDEEIDVTINLVELARVIPREDTQRVDISVVLQWNNDAEPVRKDLPIYIDLPLAKRLWSIRDAANRLTAAKTNEERDAAFAEISAAGFSAEAARWRDRLPRLQ